MHYHKNFIVSFVRHGQSKSNIGEFYEDSFHRDDSPLSVKGLCQAEKLAQCTFLSDAHKLYSSPLIRAVQTAYPTAQRLNKNIVLLSDLLEINTEIAGTDADFLKREYPLALPCECEPTPTGGALRLGAETDESRMERARRCIDYFYNEAEEGQQLLVVSHGSYLTYLISAALGLDSIENFSFQADNCAVTRVIFRRDKCPKLSFVNFTGHLDVNPLCDY